MLKLIGQSLSFLANRPQEVDKHFSFKKYALLWFVNKSQNFEEKIAPFHCPFVFFHFNDVQVME